MDETLTSVNAEQVSDEGLQNADPAPQTDTQEQTVNADNVEVTPDKPVQSKEENAQFANVRREAEARAKAELAAQQAQEKSARDAKIAALGYVDAQGNPIATEEAYWSELERQRQVNALIGQGVDPEKAALQIERDQLRQRVELAAREAQEQQKRTADYTAFLDAFKEYNGRDFNPDSDKLPEEVIVTAKAQGIPLKYAYAEHIAKQKIEREKALGAGKATAEANAKNASTTPGSLAGGGSAESGEITQADIEAHANDRTWVRKNLAKIHKYYGLKG